jgi:ubiquinone/menaquinone biosynthesis C-methylase UbiE
MYIYFSDNSFINKIKTMSNKSAPPSSSVEFDKAYKSSIGHWMWSDMRIPKQLVELIETNNPKNSLELGCGLGIFSAFVAEQGIRATSVDFSSVAIEKAKKRVAGFDKQPAFIVGDVTNLEMLSESFDISFDIGCFHCLNEQDQKKYVSEVYRLLKPGAVHLIWALYRAPGGSWMDPDHVTRIFENRFMLVNSEFSRRRVVASHWYWLVSAKLK